MPSSRLRVLSVQHLPGSHSPAPRKQTWRGTSRLYYHISYRVRTTMTPRQTPPLVGDQPPHARYTIHLGSPSLPGIASAYCLLTGRTPFKPSPSCHTHRRAGHLGDERHLLIFALRAGRRHHFIKQTIWDGLFGDTITSTLPHHEPLQQLCGPTRV